MCTQLQEIYNYFKKDHDNINDYIGRGKNILHKCIMFGFYDYVKKCIELGADVNKPTGHGTFPVYIALVNNHFKIAEILLQNGADPNVKVNGVHPFSWVIYTGYIYDKGKTVHLLIKYGILLNEIHGYNNFKRLSGQQKIFLQKKIAHRKWIVLKALSKFLAIHKRAVITANHPERLKQLGTFEEM